MLVAEGAAAAVGVELVLVVRDGDGPDAEGGRVLIDGV